VIALLNKTVYNGDALSRFRVKAADFPIHQYYTIGISGVNLDCADIIREYNIVHTTVVNGLIICSGNTQDWIFLCQLMKQSDELADVAIADNIVAALPDVFINVPSSALVKRK
jgi:hypothetical protein